jgi:ribosome maturation factor RimP
LGTEILQQVEELTRPIVERRGAYVVEARLRGEKKGKVLEIFIDTDEGVSTDVCAEVSRELSAALDAAETVRGSYQLVVSSPGTDTPLRFLRQYRKNVGRTMAIRRRGILAPVEGQLTEIDGETVVLRHGKPGTVERIPFAEIEEALVKTPW